MKRFCILTVVLFATSFSFSYNAKNTRVASVEVLLNPSLVQNDERGHNADLLNWEDFRSEPDSSSPWGALTHSGIRLHYEYRKNRDSLTAVVRISPYMDSHKSWCKPMAMNDYTLWHEQRHFDITAIVAHELAHEIEQTNFRLIDFAATIMKLHGTYIERLQKMQDAYDTGTAHGDNFIAQQNWNKKIDSLLYEKNVARR